jgi:hypothetical protein
MLEKEVPCDRLHPYRLRGRPYYLFARSFWLSQTPSVYLSLLSETIFLVYERLRTWHSLSLFWLKYCRCVSQPSSKVSQISGCYRKDLLWISNAFSVFWALPINQKEQIVSLLQLLRSCLKRTVFRSSCKNSSEYAQDRGEPHWVEFSSAEMQGTVPAVSDEQPVETEIAD